MYWVAASCAASVGSSHANGVYGLGRLNGRMVAFADIVHDRGAGMYVSSDYQAFSANIFISRWKMIGHAIIMMAKDAAEKLAPMMISPGRVVCFSDGSSDCVVVALHPSTEVERQAIAQWRPGGT
jgi:hypothetical protein